MLTLVDVYNRVMVVDTSSGGERFEEGFRYLVDASGTYNQPAWAGMGGVPAMGERALVQEGRVIQHIPNFEMEKERFINKTTAVVGTGASAITVIARLKKLSEEGIGRVKIVWICRKGKEPYTRVQNDVLPQVICLQDIVLNRFVRTGQGALHSCSKPCQA